VPDYILTTLEQGGAEVDGFGEIDDRKIRDLSFVSGLLSGRQ
jgi:hypothetical protein